MDIEVRIETSPGIWERMLDYRHSNDWPITVWLADPPICSDAEDTAARQARAQASEGETAE